jgi:hypothetical protein
MSDEGRQEGQPNASVAPEPVLAQSVSPDECGPPEPVLEAGWSLHNTVTTLTLLAIGGVIFGVLGLASSPCRGATRSSRLRWEQRDREIQEAWSQEQASGSSAPRPTSDTPYAENE